MKHKLFKREGICVAMCGDNIREFRRAHNMTQKKLAKRLNISASTLSMYEQNRRYPNIDMLYKLSCIFNVPIDKILGLDNYEIVYNNQATSYVVTQEQAKVIKEFISLSPEKQSSFLNIVECVLNALK